MAVKLGSARIDENGQAHGGAAGDQTGKEVSTQSWYAHSKGWVMLRAKSTEAREAIARCMQAACDNKHIGYDQYQRDTLYNEAKQYGFDVSKVTKNVETDCSALVRVCVNYAGIKVGSFRTTNQASVLMATGAFDKYTDDTHCKKSTNLLRGDILVTKTQGHTVVVLSDGSNAAKERAANPGTDTAPESGVLAKGSEGVEVTAMRREESTQAKALADAAAAIDKATKAVAALEEQAIKALTGESQLDLGIINQLMPKQKAALQAAQEEYQRILMVNQAEEETLAEKRALARKVGEWANIFATAPMSQKRMILAEIIDRVEIGAGYKINIEFKITARQFLEPDADAAGDQKVS